MSENTWFYDLFCNLGLPQHGEKWKRRKMIPWSYEKKEKAQLEDPIEPHMVQNVQLYIPCAILPLVLNYKCRHPLTVQQTDREARGMA
jgi:hypothetical protein